MSGGLGAGLPLLPPDPDLALAWTLGPVLLAPPSPGVGKVGGLPELLICQEILGRSPRVARHMRSGLATGGPPYPLTPGLERSRWALTPGVGKVGGHPKLLITIKLTST